MLLAFIDEANPEPNTPESPTSRFLIFGTVLVNSETSADLINSIEQIRNDCGFHRSDPLKFSLSDKPEQVAKEEHARAKELVLQAAADSGVRTILYCALHKIIDVNGQDTYLNWGIDACLTKIQQFYREEGLTGGMYCFLDRHSRSSMSQYMRTKFQERNHQARPGHRTPDLIGVGQVWDGTSHLTSLCDIVTGSFNYIVNNPDRDIAGKKLIKLIKPLVWCQPNGEGALNVLGRGLLFRPEEPFQVYQPYYHETKSRIIDWANEQA